MSTDVQLKGDSLRRQLAASQRYAADHTLELVSPIEDIGVSGYRGSNREFGNLARFLEQIEGGLVELAEEQFALADIITLQPATYDRPASLCEARVLIEMYDVGRDYEKLNSSPKPSTSSGMQDRLEAFEREPTNLMRLGARRQVEVGVRYSTGQTDDGRTTVRVEAK